MSNRGAWTDERDAVALRHYATSRPVRDILAEINALPGSPITDGGLRSFAKNRGLRRPPEAIEVARRAVLRMAWRAPVGARTQGSARWTAERVATLRELYPTCSASAQAHAVVSAMPGDKIEIQHVRRKAFELNLKLSPARVSPHSSLADRWTVERVALFLALRDTMPLIAVTARLNELPGAHIAKSELTRHARRLGLPPGKTWFAEKKPRKSRAKLPELRKVRTKKPRPSRAKPPHERKAAPSIIKPIRAPAYSTASASHPKARPVVVNVGTDDVAAWIAAHGVTRCPAAAAACTTATIAATDAAALAAYREKTQEETGYDWRRRRFATKKPQGIAA